MSIAIAICHQNIATCAVKIDGYAKKFVSPGSAAFHGGAMFRCYAMMESEGTRPRAAVEDGATGAIRLG